MSPTVPIPPIPLLPFSQFQSLLRTISPSTTLDPLPWTVLELAPLEHDDCVEGVLSFDRQVESFGRLVGAYEDGVGDSGHLKKAIDDLVEGIRSVCAAVCPKTWPQEQHWEANLSALQRQKNPPTPFDVSTRKPVSKTSEEAGRKEGEELGRKAVERGSKVFKGSGGKVF
ncbi:hypothetical protein JCM16303_004098 [Sporobolomyces ruberrimus]